MAARIGAVILLLAIAVASVATGAHGATPDVAKCDEARRDGVQRSCPRGHSPCGHGCCPSRAPEHNSPTLP